jgi:hypothetical protein
MSARARRGSGAEGPAARNALRVAPPCTERVGLVPIRRGLAERRREGARLGATPRACRRRACGGRGPVRAQSFNERVAPGGNVGVEVLECERVGPKAPGGAQ